MAVDKWPKILQKLTPQQELINNDFMQYWHEVLGTRLSYYFIEKFNHQYVIKNAPGHFLSTLEIGAGLGEHLKYEKLSLEQKKNYVALDLRENMAAQIKVNFPEIQSYVADCQQTLPFPEGHFDRILAVHVLEHLPNLPAAVKEMYRLCNKERGCFSIVIPCEGGLAYTLARKISAQRIFERRYQQSYQWFIEREHINQPYEILQELEPYFHIKHRRFFPFLLPMVHSNLCIGMTLYPRD